jgi:hypothetical protein
MLRNDMRRMLWRLFCQGGCQGMDMMSSSLLIRSPCTRQLQMQLEPLHRWYHVRQHMLLLVYTCVAHKMKHVVSCTAVVATIAAASDSQFGQEPGKLKANIY